MGRLAGLPPVVISRAKQVMGEIEKHSKIAIGLREEITKRQGKVKKQKLQEES